MGTWAQVPGAGEEKWADLGTIWVAMPAPNEMDMYKEKEAWKMTEQWVRKFLL